MVYEVSMTRYPVKTSTGYMLFSAVLGIILGLVMLFYPGGTMDLMRTGFQIFQILLTVFILYYTLSEAINHIKTKQTWRGAAYLLIGCVFTALIWLFKVDFLYYIIGIFLLITGMSEVIGSFMVPLGRYFFLLLGIVDLFIGVIVLRNPVILAILIAWYVLFWGISRMLLALELRHLAKASA